MLGPCGNTLPPQDGFHPEKSRKLTLGEASFLVQEVCLGLELDQATQPLDDLFRLLYNIMHDLCRWLDILDQAA